MKRFLFVLICLVCVPTCLFGQATSGQEPASNIASADLEQKASYIIGFDFAQGLRENQVDVDLEQVVAGIRAALEGKELGMSDEEIQAVMGAFQKVCEERMNKHLEELAMENDSAGEAYLKANLAKEGVTALPSGVQYKILASGKGAIPQVEDQVKVHYTGKTIDGKVFDSSAGGEPAIFPVGGLIKGMTEVLQKMKVGDKWEVSIPASLAYGKRGPAEIGPNQVLIFELELIDIVK